MIRDSFEKQDSAESLVALVADWYGYLLDQAHSSDPDRVLLRLLHSMVVLRFCESRNCELPDSLLGVAHAAELSSALRKLLGRARQRWGDVFAEQPPVLLFAVEESFRELIRTLYTPRITSLFVAAPIEVLGQVYEQCLALIERGATKKAAGIYYTPASIAHGLVEQTVGKLCAAPSKELSCVRVLDPACGAGIFLLHAYRRLWSAHLELWKGKSSSARSGRILFRDDKWQLTLEESQRILQDCIFGVDRDRHALELAKLTLVLEMFELTRGEQLHLFGRDRPSVDIKLMWGDSLLPPAFAASAAGGALAAEHTTAYMDWSRLSPAREGGFHAVLGNPPWGQKTIEASDAIKSYLRREYPSSRGIFDWFRPFVELGIRLTRNNGYVGMVLPDTLLLKNYEPTRRLILDHLAMEKIEWLGMAFSGATIDAVTIAGRKTKAGEEHSVEVVVNDPGTPMHHSLRQDDFRTNPRCVFNLHLTEDKRDVLDALREHSRLGDYFEVHEGIHSGNIRAELFVSVRVDGTCHELFFGRDELRPYLLKWAGYYVRLSALPERRTRERYANLGQPGWYEAAKVLVRRTGDRVTAAVDEEGRYASNNFFVVVPRRSHPLNLDGLAALLNSKFMTWYFQLIEPRKGRAFAEIKIKHLVDFPFPAAEDENTCKILNALGAKKREACYHRPNEHRIMMRLDQEIDRAVVAALGLDHDSLGGSYAGTANVLDRRTA